MAEEAKIIEIKTTADSRDLAEKITKGLLEARLCACVATYPNVVSNYWWKEKLEKATEYGLVITTLDSKYELVEKFILENHTYETPEIIAVYIAQSSPGYFAWVKEVLR